MSIVNKEVLIRNIITLVLIVMFVSVIMTMQGCAGSIMRTPAPLEEGQTDREFITLRTGQTCEVKGSKIIACERNTFRYAESKTDLEIMKEEAKEEQ